MAEVIDRQTLHALQADTRQSILKMLSKRPYTASELSKHLGKHVTTITEHLNVLEKSNVVRKKESTNKWIYYELTDKGSKFFRPYYSWVLVLSVSLIAFVVGLSQVFFASYSASTFTAGEMLKTTQDAAAPAIAQTTESVQTYNTNLAAGALLIAAAIILLWYAMRVRKKNIAERKRLAHEIMAI